MRLVYSAVARRDLREIFAYIHDTLQNPPAANNILSKIATTTQRLVRFPELGTSLQAVDAQFAGFRFVLADNYIIVYRFTDDRVEIARILYARSNYIQRLRE